MSRLDEKIGTMAYDGLIVANEPVADVFSATIRKGAAELERGAVLALSEGSAGDGKMVILGTTAVADETLKANCILADPVKVTADADVVATAYRAGHFNRGALILKEGSALSATDEEDLRKGGILLSDALGY